MPYHHASALLRTSSLGLRGHGIYNTYKSQEGKIFKMHVVRYCKKLQTNTTALQNQTVCNYPFKLFLKLSETITQPLLCKEQESLKILFQELEQLTELNTYNFI